MKKIKESEINQKDINRIEFHRLAMALISRTKDEKPGVVFFVAEKGYERSQWFCNCSIEKSKTCP